jgi:uncharacterized protein (DUF885 family)
MQKAHGWSFGAVGEALVFDGQTTAPFDRAALATLPTAVQMYENDPYNDFGRLSGEIWRAIRLVVDTGIHAKGWTQQQAEDYFIANSAQPAAAIKSEIERYILNPGQATAYKVGMIRIQKMRDKARAELGDKFSYPAFHDQILGGGALPMPVLEAKIDRWIEKQKVAQ